MRSHMKKNILLALFSSLLVFTQIACDNYKDEYLEDFNTILYFRNSGEVPITLYRTGEDDIFKIVVNKAGSKLETQTNASILILDESALAIYNAEKGTKYKALPSNCYEIKDALKCTFGSSDTYKTVDVIMKTDNIYQLQLQDKSSYVLPIQLIDSKDSINSKKKYSFITPNIETPVVYFTKKGFNNTIITKNDPDEISLTLPIELIVTNKWTFNCEVTANEDLLRQYNEENNTAYRLLPKSAYTINNIVPFTPGRSIEDVNIIIKKSFLNMGTYILPLELSKCTQKYFLIDPLKNNCLYGISYTPPRDELKRVILTANMLTSNAAQSGEGSLANLLDGDLTTYFHSSYSPAIYDKFGHYIDIKLPNEVNSIAFNYTTRHNNANGAPKVVKLWGSNTGNADSWELFGVISSGLPTGKSGIYSSSVFSSPTAFKYFRFAVTEGASGKMNETSSSFFALAEFSLYTK